MKLNLVTMQKADPFRQEIVQKCKEQYINIPYLEHMFV
jgi:hypothetical protein